MRKREKINLSRLRKRFRLVLRSKSTQLLRERRPLKREGHLARAEAKLAPNLRSIRLPLPVVASSQLSARAQSVAQIQSGQSGANQMGAKGCRWTGNGRWIAIGNLRNPIDLGPFRGHTLSAREVRPSFCTKGTSSTLTGIKLTAHTLGLNVMLFHQCSTLQLVATGFRQT